MEKENTIGTVKNRGKELFLDIFYDIAGSLLMSIGIFCFIETADIAPGRRIGRGDHAQVSV